MTISYQWIFPVIVANNKPDFPGKVVTQFNWQIKARDGNATASTSGVVPLGSPEISDFILYDKVGAGTLQKWAENFIGENNVLSIKRGLAEEISAQLNKPQKQLPNPPKVD
jgi:hypothetical protein